MKINRDKLRMQWFDLGNSKQSRERIHDAVAHLLRR